MVVYCCDEGYQFDSGLGAVKLTCEENKEWNGNAPTCIREFFTTYTRSIILLYLGVFDVLEFD